MRDDIVIVGAGFAGLTLALWCQRSGARVTLVDRLTPGDPTGLSAAPVTAQQGLLYHHVERWHGTATAQRTADALLLAEQDVTDLADELDVAVTPTRAATATDDGHEAFWLRYEAMAMHRVGVEAEFDDVPRLPWPVRPYVTSDAWTLDPVAYRDALLVAFRDAGGTLREHVPTGPAIRVSATPWPTVARGAVRDRLTRATWRWATVAGLGLAGSGLDRAWDLIDQGGALLVPTADGAHVGAPARDPLAWLAARGQRVRVLARWEATTTDSFDGLPYVGPIGRAAHVMAGFGPWELTRGTAAARQVHTHLVRPRLVGDVDSRRATWPWSPRRRVRPETLGRAAWGALRLRMNLNSVTPFPKAPSFRTTHHR